MTRVSIIVEKLGIPTVTLCCDGFHTAGRFNAKAEGYPNLPYAVHPGHVNTTPNEEVYKNAAELMVDQVIKGLTVQPADAKPVRIPGKRDTIFSGSFEEVNEFFLEREWSDGLPIVPPTVEKVEQFLKFTDRSPDEIIGILKPENREATIWNIAVTGVMCGCRPEYMPVLIGIVEALCDPAFTQDSLGHTPGTEVLMVLNGTIIKQLGFNYTQGVLRPGFQANTSVGRFFRMYLRNIAGFLPHKTDKGCYGDNFRMVLAENEDAVAKLGWEPYSVDRGFKAGDNVITITTCTERTQAIEVGWPTAEEILQHIEKRMADNHMFIQFFFRGDRTKPMIVLTPLIVESLVREGYTKEMVKQHFYENAKFRLSNLRGRLAERFHKGIDDGNYPEQLGTSHDISDDRLVQMLACPEDIQIVVSGDPGRDHVLVCAQNGFIGPPTSKKIELPANWEQLLKAAKNK
ncbi:hypothetical protein EYB31_20160 [Paenibacillus thalictri]|uniref:UGSC-like domain-containing protein n=1 Tax=Paenibacillus thalictri TaxID=2527873 RepID=A0A4Q9DM55_9BACL|nr:hypothetical protein [Paenibacillus thalictri]TBL76312.1 hypothetical protein EYB31_20160 [Paenibacillus thalictri]